MFGVIKKTTIYLAIFLTTVISVQAQSETVKELFQAVDQSISGVKITTRSTTITPKERYNDMAAMNRNNALIRQRQTKERVARRSEKVEFNFPDVEESYPMATEDVYKITEKELIYANGEIQMTAEISPDSAGGSQFIRQTVLLGLTEDITIIFHKVSNDTLDPAIEPFARIEKKPIPTKLFSRGAHAYGRGLSSFSGTNMVMSKDTESANEDKYIISIEAGSNEPEFTHAVIHVDKSKGFCWTDAYFYNQEVLKEELHASDFRLVDGYWFPFHMESTFYLPESDRTEENIINHRSFSEITSLEIDPSLTLNAESLITPDMKVYRR